MTIKVPASNESLEFLFLRAQKGNPQDVAAYEEKLRAKEEERKTFIKKLKEEV